MAKSGRFSKFLSRFPQIWVKCPIFTFLELVALEFAQAQARELAGTGRLGDPDIAELLGRLLGLEVHDEGAKG